ncbi:MAG: carboxypeptidase-like regulatory domain-containing protein [Prolixibacteraceae bacterium]|nr:carboxypeptidase-like regulatory domain-containing protein [Prolixibacteraceae bacterium]
MKTQIKSRCNNHIHGILLMLIVILCIGLKAEANFINTADSLKYKQFKGSVIDMESRKALGFATMTLEGTNLSTVANSEGEFSFKVPLNLATGNVVVSYLGHKDKILSLTVLKPERNRIELELLTVTLSTISVHPRDPDMLMSAIMNQRAQNYSQDQNKMIVFYRETIKKNKTYVSLSEAVLDLYKQPCLSGRSDQIELSKGRKSTDYTRLDTITFKLQGGPYTSVLLDIMKNPEMVFTEEMMKNYDFTIENISKIGDRLMYVIDFKQNANSKEPLYYGKLYVDTESLAIISATFSLNVEDKFAASDLFIRKKPMGAKVYPTEATYQVNYREKGGKWFFGYSRAEIIFKIEWKKRLFNTHYASTIEMAVTDWTKSPVKNAKPTDRLKPYVVMMDEVSGFADPEFWGVYNVIEPEKSIEQAIRKIQRKMKYN